MNAVFLLDAVPSNWQGKWASYNGRFEKRSFQSQHIADHSIIWSPSASCLHNFNLCRIPAASSLKRIRERHEILIRFHYLNWSVPINLLIYALLHLHFKSHPFDCFNRRIVWRPLEKWSAGWWKTAKKRTQSETSERDKRLRQASPIREQLFTSEIALQSYGPKHLQV